MAQYRQEGQLDPGKIRTYLTIAGIIIVAAILFGKILIKINPGQAGVVFKPVSQNLDVEHVYYEGYQLVLPWNEMIVYDVTEQNLEETMEVLSSNGLGITVDVSLRFRAEPEQIGRLHMAFRGAYIENLVRPELRSAVRRIVGRYTPEELYSTKREEIESSINEATLKVLETNNVNLKALLIRSVVLPPTIQGAIEKKLKQEQESLEYEFKLTKEKKEAERKKIEADGIKLFQEVVNQGLTPNYLKWKGIEATLELAKSPNSKVVVVGSGKDGLPLILGGN